MSNQSTHNFCAAVTIYALLLQLCFNIGADVCFADAQPIPETLSALGYLSGLPSNTVGSPGNQGAADGLQALQVSEYPCIGVCFGGINTNQHIHACQIILYSAHCANLA